MSLKAKLLQEKYEAKLEFLGCPRVQNKKPSMGEYGYFLERHIPKYIPVSQNMDINLQSCLAVHIQWVQL